MKNIVLTVDFGKLPPWAIQAKSSQLADWLEKNKKDMPFDNIIILPDAGATQLYWLEGEINNNEHRLQLLKLRDRLKPVLCAIVDMDHPKEDPGYKKAIGELKELRELKLRKMKDIRKP
jgi:hypothetical protein